MQKQPKDSVIIASDVSYRDGIGIEIYRNDELVWRGQGQTLKAEYAIFKLFKMCIFYKASTSDTPGSRIYTIMP